MCGWRRCFQPQRTRKAGVHRCYSLERRYNGPVSFRVTSVLQLTIDYYPLVESYTNDACPVSVGERTDTIFIKMTQIPLHVAGFTQASEHIKKEAENRRRKKTWLPPIANRYKRMTMGPEPNIGRSKKISYYFHKSPGAAQQIHQLKTVNKWFCETASDSSALSTAIWNNNKQFNHLKFLNIRYVHRSM